MVEVNTHNEGFAMAPAKGRFLTVDEVASRSGLPVSTLHFYESKGLVHSVRTSGNQRRFGREALRVIAIVKVAQRAGIPLAAIRAKLDRLPAGKVPSRADWSEMASAWRLDLDDRITRLTRLRDQMAGCIGCGCLSLDACPLRNPDDILGQDGRGPRLLDPEG